MHSSHCEATDSVSSFKVLTRIFSPCCSILFMCCVLVASGDFDVPSSREDVDRDSAWNLWLSSNLHDLFVDALQSFKVNVNVQNYATFPVM